MGEILSLLAKENFSKVQIMLIFSLAQEKLILHISSKFLNSDFNIVDLLHSLMPTLLNTCWFLLKVYAVK